MAKNAQELDKNRKLLAQKEADLATAERRLDEMVANGSAALGGSMVLVDLAGADYDGRQGAAQKETAAINKSLLVLKECFRSLAKVSSQRAPFRSSKLTRMLQDSLEPTKFSRRRNKEDNASVMLVNISPATQLKKQTTNALRYGQMMGAGKTHRKVRSTAKSTMLEVKQEGRS